MTKVTVCADTEKGIKSPQRPDITYQYPLFILSIMTGLSSVIRLKDYHASTCIFHQIYSLCLVVFIAAASIYSGRGRVKYVYKYMLQTIRINDLIQQFLLSFSICFAIINVVLRGGNFLQGYFDKLRKIDSFLSTTMNLRSKRMFYYIRFFLFHFMFIILAVSDYFVWTAAMEYDLWKHYSFRLYLFYTCLLIVLQLLEYACTLHTRFVILNERLLDTFMNWSKDFDQQAKKEMMNELFPNAMTLVANKYLTVKVLTQIHEKMCDILDAVNDNFGFNIFMLIANIIVNTVLALNTILLFATGMLITFNPHYSEYVVALNVGWAFFFAVSTY